MKRLVIFFLVISITGPAFTMTCYYLGEDMRLETDRVYNWNLQGYFRSNLVSYGETSFFEYETDSQYFYWEEYTFTDPNTKFITIAGRVKSLGKNRYEVSIKFDPEGRHQRTETVTEIITFQEIYEYSDPYQSGNEDKKFYTILFGPSRSLEGTPLEFAVFVLSEKCYIHRSLRY